MSRAAAARSAPPPAPRAAEGLRPRILVVDDESSLREMLRIVLRRDGYDVIVADSGRAAIDMLQRERVDLLLSDIRMADVSGVEVLKAAKTLDRDIVAFLMTAFASTETAVEAMRLGAVDYFTKPFSMDEMRLKVRQHLETKRLKQENVLLKRALNTSHEFSSIIGRSDAMLAVFRMIETVAQTGSTVLVTGESGTGKELVARAIHFNSLRRDHPFVAVNCGAVPETLLESELFGHMRGAFTGADSNKKGLLEVADRGTIFLDEIGEMNTTMQVKLLRVLQERRFRRLGGTEESQADIRVVAATNQDLAKLVADGRFREDLYYRINVIPMHLPPLRERREDIELLAAHFLDKHAARAGKAVRGLSQEAAALLSTYDWPGNVRELENVIERCVALEQTPVILAETLPPNVRTGAHTVLSRPSALRPSGVPEFPALGDGFNLEARGEDFYRHYIALALERAGGVQVKAAEMLGMSFRSFRYYAKKLNVAMRRDDGFTLIELMMVVAILGILASMAVMSLWRSRSAANEAAAVGALRTITSGQIAYTSSCGRGSFAGSLPQLGPQPLTPIPYLPPDLTAGAMVQKSGYRIQLGPSATAVPGALDCNGNPTRTGYYAWSEPLLFGTTGTRSFATVSPTNVIWQNYAAVAPPEPFGAPASPVQ